LCGIEIKIYTCVGTVVHIQHCVGAGKEVKSFVN